MQWRHQMGALLGALVLLTALFAAAVRALAPVTAADASMLPREPHFSSKPKTTFNNVTSFEIDTPYTGSIESPWDAGSLWDEGAPYYDLRPGD
jgi:hypothetical protein